MSITSKIMAVVKQTVEEYNMFSNGDTVIIGVSGGADSVMLLHCLKSLKEEYGISVVAAHVNHKIRPGDAENDALFVENLCKEWGIEFYLREADIKSLSKEWSMSEEEAGRKVRYGFFDDLARIKGGAKIATAHNANDNVETVLMRFMRGTGIQGLSGISFKRDNIIRPILAVTREDIEAYIEENGLTHITDKTNFESIYTRNKIRLELIPFMKDMFNPNLIETVNNSIETYREDADYFEVESERLFNRFTEVKKNSIECSLICLKNNHPALAKRVIIKCIKAVMSSEQTGVGSAEIDKIYQGIDSEVGTIFILNKEYRIRVSYNSFIFEKIVEKKKNMDVYEYEFGAMDEEFVTYPSFDLNLDYMNVYDMNIVNTPIEFYLPYEEYKGKNLQIRTRRDGDIFRVEDGVSKKLNRVMTDKKIDSEIRDNIVLLCDGNEVLCAFGYFVTRFAKRSGEFMKIRVQ